MRELWAKRDREKQRDSMNALAFLEWLFDQEYPATAALAFRTSTMNPLISPAKVQMAVTSKIRDDLAKHYEADREHAEATAGLQWLGWWLFMVGVVLQTIGNVA